MIAIELGDYAMAHLLLNHPNTQLTAMNHAGDSALTLAMEGWF